MGYSALGKIRKEWIPHVREYYEKFVTPLTTVFTLGEKLNLVFKELKFDINVIIV